MSESRKPALPRPVKNLNANWAAGSDGEDGTFQVMIVTNDDEHYTVAPSPAAVTALIALSKANTVLLWDAQNRSLIAANVVGTWIVPAGLARARVDLVDD